MTIRFEGACVRLSLAVAAALLEFASKDATRPHIAGVGVSEKGRLGATDGRAAVLFDGEVRGGPVFNGRVWARHLVETRVRVAKAERATEITLTVEEMNGPNAAAFPPIERVMPERGIEGCDANVGVDPALLGKLGKVAKACAAKGVQISTVRGPLDPIGFYVRGPDVGATVAIMPLRV